MDEIAVEAADGLLCVGDREVEASRLTRGARAPKSQDARCAGVRGMCVERGLKRRQRVVVAARVAEVDGEVVERLGEVGEVAAGVGRRERAVVGDGVLAGGQRVVVATRSAEVDGEVVE